MSRNLPIPEMHFQNPAYRLTRNSPFGGSVLE